MAITTWQTGQRLRAKDLDDTIAACLPLVGGTLTGPLILNADPAIALGAATKQYVDAIASTSGAVLLTGSTMTGALILSGDPSTALGAVTKQYSDTKLPKAGGTLTGALVLAADPGTALGAATKQYVDAVSTVANAALSRAGGTLTGALLLAADPSVALGAATKQYVDNAAFTSPGSVAKSGSTMTGALILNADPTAALGAATKQYVDAVSTIVAGTLLLSGGTMSGLLTLVGNPTGPLNAAPKQYVDASAGINTGRNYLDNPLFTIQQRGPGPTFIPGDAYGPDRWLFASAHAGGGSASQTIVALTDAQRSSIGDEEAQYGLVYAFTGGSAAGDLDVTQQKIEGVRRLSGKVVTISFVAFAASGTPKLGISVDQVFGTGGSPSASANGTGTFVTLSTTPTRYFVIKALPSASGKTFGTNGDDNTVLNFWYSSGSTNNSRAGSIGVQSGSVTLWGPQHEAGSFMTPLEKRDIATELARCQRFYSVGAFSFISYNTTGGAVGQTVPLPVTMRTAPTVSATYTTQTNATGGTIQAVGNGAVELYATTTATGAVGLAGTFTAKADL
jgi:hypothetical protein